MWALELNRDSPTMAPRASEASTGREQARERRHEVDAAVVLDLGRQVFAVRRAADDAEADRAATAPPNPSPRSNPQGVNGFRVAELIADGGQQPVLAADDLLPVLSSRKFPVP